MIQTIPKLQEWLEASEDNRVEFQQWLSLPITQIALGGARAELRPASVSMELLATKPMELTLATHAQFIGEHKVLDRLERALDICAKIEESESATYGANQAMEEEYGENAFDETGEIDE